MLSNYTICLILAAGCRYSTRNVETARKKSGWGKKDNECRNAFYEKAR